jgi:tRNA-2-methylthio-N6-dimethylallyladenosine synthase
MIHPLKVYIRTFGCQMNTYDSQKILEIMQAALGMQETNNPEEADLLVLNTCSVREKPQEKVFSELGIWNGFKKRKPGIVIAVGGCVATQEGKNIIRRAPYVDIVFGPQTLHKLPQLYTQAKTSTKKIVDTEFQAAEKFANLPQPKIAGPIASITIMEGCNKYCSYCIVPYTRGREVSRKIEEILAECEFLSNQGVKEITFLGQNVNDYQHANYNFAALLRETAKINGIERIRFMTSYPTGISDEIIELYAAEPKISSYMHLPVQSGSDKILQAMRRRYTIAEYKETVAKLRKVRPDILITSDFIVGFPGETEEDFQATMDLVKEIDFDISYSFMYSPRPKTLAAKLVDDVPLAIKKQRLKILQDQLNLQAIQHAEKLVGTVQMVLIEGQAKYQKNQLTGRADNNRVVNFDISKYCSRRSFYKSGVAILAKPEACVSNYNDLIGKIIPIKITRALKFTLFGEINK